MYIVRRYVVRLTDDHYVVIDMGFDPPNAMVDATVHYAARIRGRWHEVGRYDAAHGVPQVHRFWVSADSTRALPGTPIRDFVERGKRDFLRNWRIYRARMELKVR